MYDLLPGYLRVSTGDAEHKIHEFDIDLAFADVYPTALPGKPYCVIVHPNLAVKNVGTLVMEADSPAVQEKWYEAIRKQMSALKA